MKKLFLLLAIIMLLPFRGISQNDTIINLPLVIARKVVSDLIRLDYTEKMIVKQNRQIQLLEEKLVLKDSVIQAKQRQAQALEKIKSEQDKHLLLIEQSLATEQEKTNALKFQRGIITTGSIIITLIILIIK